MPERKDTASGVTSQAALSTAQELYPELAYYLANIYGRYVKPPLKMGTKFIGGGLVKAGNIAGLVVDDAAILAGSASGGASNPLLELIKDREQQLYDAPITTGIDKFSSPASNLLTTDYAARTAAMAYWDARNSILDVVDANRDVKKAKENALLRARHEASRQGDLLLRARDMRKTGVEPRQSTRISSDVMHSEAGKGRLPKPLKADNPEIEAPIVDFASLRMSMAIPEITASDAMAAFNSAFEKAQSAKLMRDMAALGLDSAGQPLRNSVMQDATYQPRMPIRATGIRTGSDSIYKPTSAPSIYTDDSLREPDLPSTDESTSTSLLFG